MRKRIFIFLSVVLVLLMAGCDSSAIMKWGNTLSSMGNANLGYGGKTAVEDLDVEASSLSDKLVNAVSSDTTNITDVVSDFLSALSLARNNSGNDSKIRSILDSETTVNVKELLSKVKDKITEIEDEDITGALEDLEISE